MSYKNKRPIIGLNVEEIRQEELYDRRIVINEAGRVHFVRRPRHGDIILWIHKTGSMNVGIFKNPHQAKKKIATGQLTVAQKQALRDILNKV